MSRDVAEFRPDLKIQFRFGYWPESIPSPSVPAGTEVIVSNRTDLFRNISMLSLPGKIDVGCHLLKDRAC